MHLKRYYYCTHCNTYSLTFLEIEKDGCYVTSHLRDYRRLYTEEEISDYESKDFLNFHNETRCVDCLTSAESILIDEEIYNKIKAFNLKYRYTGYCIEPILNENSALILKDVENPKLDIYQPTELALMSKYASCTIRTTMFITPIREVDELIRKSTMELQLQQE